MAQNKLERPLLAQLLFFTLVRIVFNTVHRMVYPFLAVFARGLGVDVGQVSAALTLRAGLGSLSPLLATIADTRGRRFGMLIGLCLFIAGLLLVIFQPVFWAFVGALILTTIGYLVFIPSLQAFLGDTIPYAQRGLAIALTEMGWSLSFIIGVPLVGLLLAYYDWRSPFPVILACSGVVLLMFLRIIPRDHPAARSAGSSWRNLGRVFTSRLGLTALAFSILLTAANEIVNLVMGVWMEDQFAFQVTSLGALAIGVGLAELLGETLVGVFVDRLGKIRSVAIGVCLNMAASLLLIFSGSSLVGAFVSLLLFYLTFEFTLVSSLPLMTEVLPTARASLMASNMALISLSRAAGASTALPVYALRGAASSLPGIAPNALISILLNLFALLALFYLQKGFRNA